MLVLSAIYLTSVTASYGIVFFMPQIIKGLGLSNVMTGLVTAIPYTVGVIGLLAWGYSSDRRNERRWHLGSRLLEVLVQVAVLEPTGRGAGAGFRDRKSVV